MSASKIPFSLRGAGAAAPGANPCADPPAPDKRDRSASGKLTEPLLDTPYTVTTIPKVIIADKGEISCVTSLHRVTPVTAGTPCGSASAGRSGNCRPSADWKTRNARVWPASTTT